ncbi:MAG TPA: hypothetical protein VGB43_03370 [Flavobacterium sp.]|jgi:hypothetical protein
MRILKRLFDFYLRSSIHVALAVFALVLMTQYMFGIVNGNAVAFFAFFGSITGYNFVKYDALARIGKRDLSVQLKAIAALSFFSTIACGFFFFKLKVQTQLIAFVFLGLTLLYTLPFFPNRKNARNWAGVKIYIVALCWSGVTVMLPIIDANVDISFQVYLKALQRFILVFVLILIFEIIDLSKDDPHLQTVPQQIGVKPTKILGIVLLLVFYAMEFFRIHMDNSQLIVNSVLVVGLTLLLVFANVNRSKYYTLFWVESVPVCWYCLVLLV